ncbi:MAG: imidazole glycerol phosphate synthase subunit HisH [Anaerolineae bacterium]|nr:imidazole glycerol phosphate synthase subunit HisH [Anaerolineae bacterium]
MSIVIVDYGMGNLRNVQKAFEHIGVEVTLSAHARDLASAAGLVLPGVGAFGDAMRNLNAGSLVEPLRRAVARGTPLLGICLGLQLLFEWSEEMGHHVGLGLLPGSVVRFAHQLKVPHIGWNQLEIAPDRQSNPLLRGIADRSYAYFVHSYYALPADPDCVLATTTYGHPFASIVGHGHVFGAQPHPEKSQETGLRLLRNYAEIVKGTSQ